MAPIYCSYQGWRSLCSPLVIKYYYTPHSRRFTNIFVLVHRRCKIQQRQQHSRTTYKHNNETVIESSRINCIHVQVAVSALRAELERAKDELSTLTETLVLLQRQKAEAELGRYVVPGVNWMEQQSFVSFVKLQAWMVSFLNIVKLPSLHARFFHVRSACKAMRKQTSRGSMCYRIIFFGMLAYRRRLTACAFVRVWFHKRVFRCP